MGPDLDQGRASLVRYDARGGARRRLYCVPYAGGGPSVYRLWPTSLPADTEVVVVVMPGRDPRAEYELVPTVERVAAKRRPRRMCLCGLGVLSGELSAATDPTH